MPTPRPEPLAGQLRRLAAWSASVWVLAAAFSSSSMRAAADSGPAEEGSLVKAPGAQLYVERRGGGAALPPVVANGGPGFDPTSLAASAPRGLLGTNRPGAFRAHPAT